MSIFERFTTNPEFSSDAPEGLTYADAAHTVYAPVAGAVVGNKVESMGLFGKGIAIQPATEVVYSPVSGRVSATTVTNHAIGVSSADGMDVLIHIGVDTVKMNGRGFVRFVQEGDEVKAGQALVAFDSERIRAEYHDDVVVVVVTNYDEFSQVKYVVDESVMLGGRPVLKPGEPVMQLEA